MIWAPCCWLIPHNPIAADSKTAFGPESETGTRVKPRVPVEFCGGPSGTRTRNQRIKSPLLYQLS